MDKKLNITFLSFLIFIASGNESLCFNTSFTNPISQKNWHESSTNFAEPKSKHHFFAVLSQRTSSKICEMIFGGANLATNSKLAKTTLLSIISQIKIGALNVYTYLVAYFAPAKDVLKVLFWLVFIRLLSDFWASWKKKKKIRINQLGQTIKTMFFMLLFVLLAPEIDKIIKVPCLTWFITGYIVCHELCVFFKNAGYITKYPVFMDLAKLIELKLLKKRQPFF